MATIHGTPQALTQTMTNRIAARDNVARPAIHLTGKTITDNHIRALLHSLGTRTDRAAANIRGICYDALNEHTPKQSAKRVMWARERAADHFANCAVIPTLPQPTATPVAEIVLEGRTYHRTGKVGTDRRTGDWKAEYSCHEPGLEHRAWANYDGTNPEAE